MDKPKELTGEVKKFEDWIGEWLSVDLTIPTFHFDDKDLEEVYRIYTQKFIPTMIEDYFESLDFEWTGYYQDIERAEFRNGELCDESDTTIKIFMPDPKTLSDFIDACINSDIKLTWRL